jgi:predicted metal-binding protein
MDQDLRRPVATPTRSVAQPALHQIHLCTPCRHTGSFCAPGLSLLRQLRTAIAAAEPGEAFEVSGTARLLGCAFGDDSTCVVGWRATAKATWLFGDIDPAQPIDDLVALSGQLASGECRRSGIGGHATARIPAAVIVTREGAMQ